MIKLIFTFCMCFLVFSFGTGCSLPVKVDPSPKIKAVNGKYPYKVGIYIDDAQLKQEYSRSYCITATPHKWVMPVGEALQKAAEKSFAQLFDEVENVKSPGNSKTTSLFVIFNPSVREFKVSGTLKTEFILKTTMFNKKNKVIYDKEFKGETKNKLPCLESMFVFTTNLAFSTSIDQAFEKAFEDFFADMQGTVNFNTINK